MHDTTTTNTTAAQTAPHAFTLDTSMRRNGRFRPPPPTVHFKGEDDDRKAIVTYCGFTFVTEAASWQHLAARFKDGVPPIFLRSNRGKGRGRQYLGMTLPRQRGERKGKTVMLARELVGADAGWQLCYRDRNPLNLTRENLAPKKRQVAAAEAKARGAA